MLQRTRLSAQIEEHSKKEVEPKSPAFQGTEPTISTGSTLLDLAISGSVFPKGGLPGGILVEVFGPSGCGKTVLLCEIAGGVQRKGGDIMFRDPEGRLNKRFASLFGLNVDKIDYEIPDTVKDVFEPIRKWEPKGKGINGIFADSLAALTTEMEMEGADQYGMRRAKEFSEQLRLTCRELVKKNYLMVCSNQIRQNLDAGPYGQKWKAPGGAAIEFYSSLRLRCSMLEKIKRKRKIESGKEQQKIVGVETEIEVVKSSIDQPYRKASVCILFEYGIDDIRANLQFLKSNIGGTKYAIGDHSLAIGLEESIRMVEEGKLEAKLREETIGLWREIEEKFKEIRRPKLRD